MCQAKTPINAPLPSTPFAIRVKGEYIYTNFQKITRESCYKNSARQFMLLKYNWDTLTIKNIDWMTYSSCYTSFSTIKNRNIARCIHHCLLFGKMMFVFKYICPACGLIPDSVASRDHF